MFWCGLHFSSNPQRKWRIMAHIDIDGARIHYEERGDGPPMLLVHGSASDYRTWSHVIEAFADQYRVVAYSRRYHYPNDEIEAGTDYSMMQHVKDLRRVIETLELGPVHLVGHSYGAFLSLLLAIGNPELVRKLVLAEPPVLTLFTSNQPRYGELLRLFLARPRTALSIVGFGIRGVAPATAAIQRGDREAALRIFGAAVLGPATFRGLSRERLEQARANLIDTELIGSGFAPIAAPDIAAVEAPTLLLTGERSPTIWHRFTDRLGELLPNVHRVEIPNASHIMHEDNPEGYVSEVVGHLESCTTIAVQATGTGAVMAG
jgi:non-heme chloroperoxidase